MITPDETFHIHKTAKDKGFWDGPVTPDFVLAKLCLIHSEVSEVMEAYRKQHGSAKIMEEFADVFIRLFDLIEGLAEHGIIDDYDITKAIRAKMAANDARPRLHGNII